MADGDGVQGEDGGGGAPHRFWLVTVNHPTGGEVDQMRAMLEVKAKHWVVARETAPTTGMEHVHFSIALHSAVRLATFKKIVPGCNAKWTTGSLYERFVKYCKKGGSFEEFGEHVTRSGASEAARQAREEKYRGALELAKEGKIDDIPADLYTQHYVLYRRLRAEQLSREAMKVHEEFVLNNFSKHTLYPWQAKVLQNLDKPPHDRKILWFVDEVGGKGKTSFARYLEVTRTDLQCVPLGRSADMGHVLDFSKTTFVFDIPRTVGEHVPWGFIEKLKDGTVFASKYESAIRRVRPPRIIIFSNMEPPPTTEKGGFSADRVVLVRL